MSRVTILEGNALTVLQGLPANSVQVCASSPPYWGVRNYGTVPQIWDATDPACDHEWLVVVKPAQNGIINGGMRGDTISPHSATRGPVRSAFCTRCGAWRGELGAEPTPELYIQHLVAIYREVRRVLRPDGTCWVNLGSSYAGSGRGPQGQGASEKASYWSDPAHREGLPKRGELPPGYKPKDLVPIPWLFAIAAQQDGWYLRQDVIWNKPAPMPGSQRDRPTTSHEYVIFLTKRAHYFYDWLAIAEPTVGMASAVDGLVELRNKRSVWTINTDSYAGSHYATWPRRLVEPMILAGTSAAGCCPTCGAPWRRVTARRKMVIRRDRRGTAIGAGLPGGRTAPSGTMTSPSATATLGWEPTCKCPPHTATPCTVLDPFNGVGTSGLVALGHGRDYIGIELLHEWAEESRARLANTPLFDLADPGPSQTTIFDILEEVSHDAHDGADPALPGDPSPRPLSPDAAGGGAALPVDLPRAPEPVSV